MGGGSIAGAIQSLKMNRALINKRKIRTKSDVIGQTSKTQLDVKETTPRDMKNIRKKIKKYKQKERRITAISWVITVIIIYLLCLWIIT
ncbi:hypothetical protein [Spongiimicrobium salis]|uniref:hypothetical protein n=1 Tax=Spongiimicrobium salis TaxID=1667022 RepID=UPI00374DC837